MGKTIASLPGATAAGALTTLGTGVGLAAAFLGGAYLALQQYQDLKSVLDKIKQSEAEYKGDFRFGIHNFFDGLP